MKHFLITRFNYAENYPHLEHRIRMFNQYTRPSIEAQACQNFEWLILGDPPIDLPNCKVLPREAEGGNIKKASPYGYMEYIEEQTKGEGLVLMTRLDNDDVLMPQYIRHMQALVHKPGLYEFKGYRLDLRNGNFYEDQIYGVVPGYDPVRYITSPFTTLARPSTNLKSVYSHNHSKMWMYYALTIFKTINWVQIIHTTNWLLNRPSTISIRKKGKIVPVPAFVQSLIDSQPAE